MNMHVYSMKLKMQTHNSEAATPLLGGTVPPS